MAMQAFLATTSLASHWDNDCGLVFLGSWCLRYSATKAADGGRIVLPGCLSSNERIRAERQWLNSRLDPTIVALGNLLNEIHRVNFGPRYWRVVLGPWLLNSLPYYHFRVEQIKAAHRAYPALRTAGLPTGQFIYPLDWIDFSAYSVSDGFNLQTYTQLCRHFGIEVEERPVEDAAALFVSPRPGRPAASGLKQKVWALLKAITSVHGIVGCDSHFMRTDELALLMRSGLNFLPDWRGYALPQLPAVDPALRTELVCAVRPVLQALDEPLRDILVNEMPVSYLEGYQAVRTAALESLPMSACGAFSSNAWIYHELFKFWAAERAHQSPSFKMLGGQHGGNYGSVLKESLPSEQLEIDNCDGYFTWGWADDSGKTTPMPAPKLAGRKLRRNPAATEILLVTVHASRYEGPYSLGMFSPLRFEEYLDRQRRFCEAVPEQIQKLLRVRLYHDDGWDMDARWQQWSGGRVRIERVQDRDYLDSLEDSRINVCDYLSTAVIESLSFNRPTVLHWAPAHVELRDSVLPLYAKLVEAGILHDSPQSAAHHIANVYNDVAVWWDSEVVQAARSDFCRQLGLTSPHYLSQWADMFRGVHADTERAPGRTS